MTDDEDSAPAGWGAPCDADPSEHVLLHTKSGNRHAAPAFLFGVWAVHRSVTVNDQECDPHSWAVSHIPSGRSIGVALELEFWDAIRIARALEDTGILTDKDEIGWEEAQIFRAAVGAALHDHYVWPMSTWSVS